MSDRCVEINGDVDDAYVTGVAARAGLGDRAELRGSEPLTGGRTTSRIVRLQVTLHRAGEEPVEAAWVLKTVPDHGGFRELLDEGRCLEAELWNAGLLSELPRPVECPTFDVARHVGRHEHWIALRDVSRGIVPRGEFGAEQTARLLDAVAALHARYLDRTDEVHCRVPLPAVGDRSRRFAEVMDVTGHGELAARPGLADAAAEFLPASMLPAWLDLLPTAEADRYLELARARERWIARLEAHPATLVHGDLRRANIALLEDHAVALFDWEVAMLAPPEVDLAWHWFLHVWAYPAHGASPDDRAPLLERYRERLEVLAGRRVDPRSFHEAFGLGFCRALVALGPCLQDLMPPERGKEDVARMRARSAEAIALAARAAEGGG